MKEYQRQYREKNKFILSEKQKQKRRLAWTPAKNLRQCRSCQKYFDKEILNAEPYKCGGTNYLCDPCLIIRTERQKQREEHTRKRQLKTEQALELKAQAEENKRLKELAKQRERERKKAELEKYRNSPEYLELKRQKKRANKKRQYQANPQKFLEKSKIHFKAYLKEHPEKRREWKRIRRAKKRGAGGHFTPTEWNYLLEITNNTCLRCGKTNCRLAPDHILPLGFGSDMITNIQPYCWSCNSKKLDRRHEDSRDEQTKSKVYFLAFPNLTQMMGTV